MAEIIEDVGRSVTRFSPGGFGPRRDDRCRAMGQRRGRGGRGARCADRKGLGRARDRRVGHGQTRHAPLARGTRGRRLHAGGLHPAWRPLRSHLRRPGELPGLRMQARAQARRGYVLIGHERYGASGKRVFGLVPASSLPWSAPACEASARSGRAGAHQKASDRCPQGTHRCVTDPPDLASVPRRSVGQATKATKATKWSRRSLWSRTPAAKPAALARSARRA